MSILEASLYFGISSLQEKCFQYLSLNAVHCLNDILELSQHINKNRLAELAFEDAAKNFQVAINCRYTFSLEYLRTLLTSKHLTVSNEYNLALYIKYFLEDKVEDPRDRETLLKELISLVRLGSIPIHCLLSLYYWKQVKECTGIKMMIKETYFYHTKEVTNLPLKPYLVPRRTNWHIFACNKHVIEQITLIWSNNQKAKQPEHQFKKFDGRGEIRETVWAFGFLYLFLRNDFLRFDPVWDRWVRLTQANVRLKKFTVVVFENFIYKIGGQDGFDISSKVERFSVQTNSWSHVCPLNIPTTELSAVVNEGKLLIIGGLTDSLTFSREVFTFEPVENKWRSLASMNFGRYGHQSVVFNRKVYVFGGETFEIHHDQTSEVFDSVTNQWTILHFDINFYFSYIWTDEDDLFAIEGAETSRSTKLAKIDCETNRIIRFKEPLPFTFRTGIKYAINRNS